MKIWRRLLATKVPVLGGVLASFLTFTVGIIVANLVDVSRHAISQKINGWNGWSVLVVSAGLCMNCLALLFVMKRIEELQATNRIAFQYFDRKNALGRTDLLAMVEKMEPGADFMMLNYFNRRFHGFETETQTVRAMYFKALEAKLDSINYRRIIQADPSTSLSNLVDETHLSHFRTVIQRRDQGGSGYWIQVGRVPLRYPYIFFILKNPSGSKHFCLDIFEELPNTGRFKVIGALHVTDPDEQLIAPFEALFRNLESSPELQNIRADQLDNLAAPREVPPPR